ncbi:hypothetical protein Tco_0801034 [Tanacetum coccineum]|uniref:Uncharacterized protein n=1 Tax=Tanacetum coccineum TaxID=301880 RepID=A0ABQ4ZXI8_9ASTR
MKGYRPENFNQSFGIVKSPNRRHSRFTYRDTPSGGVGFQQQPVKTKAVEGKSVKIDYRVEDGISAIESLKFPPVGSSKYGFEVNFPYSIFFRYRSKDRDVPEVVSRKVSSVYAKAEEDECFSLESQSSEGKRGAGAQ